MILIFLHFNPNSLQILEKNPEKIQWKILSKNSNAIHYLSKNLEKIDWDWLSSNSSIFMKIVDYKYLKERMDIIREELIMKCMHPRRLQKWIKMGGNIDDF